MYKVLNSDWEVVKVKEVDIKLHKHISGREFTKDDGVSFVTAKKPAVKPKTEKVEKTVIKSKKK